MTKYYAQPYDLSATGFYFEDAETYETKRASLTNDYGQPVEEFEIQFIDGEAIDAQLFKALSISQATILAFMEKVEEWDDADKQKMIIAVGEAGYDFDLTADNPDDFPVDIYEFSSLRELAEHFVEEGLWGDISMYIDYDAIARDLGYDYSETTIDGKVLVYACH